MKKQIKLYVTPDTERKWNQIKALYSNGTEAFAEMVEDQYIRDKTNWWWWAIRSAAGRKAIREAGVKVNFDNPARGIPEPEYKGHWRAQPWANPGENWEGRSWETEVNALRDEIGECAGVFYVEHITYGIHVPVTPGAHGWQRGGSDHGFLFAINDDGTRFSYRQMI